MIKETEVFPIGHITRSRGLRGEVELYFIDDTFEQGTAEYFVFSIDGIFIPFFWEEYRFKNEHVLILKLEGVDTEEQAKQLVGAKAYYPLLALPEGERELLSLQSLLGYTIYDHMGANLGQIIEVNDTVANILLFIKQPNGKELILPYHDDLLIDYDFQTRTLHLKVTEGLLHLNS